MLLLSLRSFLIGDALTLLNGNRMNGQLSRMNGRNRLENREIWARRGCVLELGGAEG